MGTRLFALTNLAAAVVASSFFFVGCSLDWSGLAMPDSGMIVLADAGDADTGTSRDGGFDAGPDAMVPDSGVMDPDTSTPDGGPPDSGIPDGGADAGDDAGSDAGTDAGTDAGPSGPALIIRMSGATAVTGIAYRNIWISGPPLVRHELGWFFDACDGGVRIVDATTVECTVYDPDLAAGHTLQFFPWDTGSGASHTSYCTRIACPGTYSVIFGGMAAAPITTINDAYDANGDGIGNTGDGAALNIDRLP